MNWSLVIILITCNSLTADELSKKTSESIARTKSKLPALELLPAGSILKKISIPRYNSDYTPSSLLTADQFEVIDDSEIRGTNVGISLYDEKGKIKTSSMLNSVRYNKNTGLLISAENLSFSGGRFITSCNGLALDWKNHCGFLLGKNQTIIYLEQSESMINNNKTSKEKTQTPPAITKQKSLIVAGTIAAAVSAPTFLSAKELTQIDTLSQPSTQLFINSLDEVKASLTATAEVEAKIAAIKKDLSDKLGTLPQVDPALPAPKELVPEKGKEFISIKSDRLLFDAKKGIFVYYGNVRITHPKYVFSCDGELKIILKETATAKKLTPEERAKLNPNDIFDDISQIIATKNVIVRGKDNKGRDVTATTENLSFNKSTGNIILKGKNSRITTAEGQLKVITNNGYIKLDQNMNASGVGTNTNFSLPKTNSKKTK